MNRIAPMEMKVEDYVEEEEKNHEPVITPEMIEHIATTIGRFYSDVPKTNKLKNYLKQFKIVLNNSELEKLDKEIGRYLRSIQPEIQHQRPTVERIVDDLEKRYIQVKDRRFYNRQSVLGILPGNEDAVKTLGKNSVEAAIHLAELTWGQTPEFGQAVEIFKSRHSGCLGGSCQIMKRGGLVMKKGGIVMKPMAGRPFGRI